MASNAAASIGLTLPNRGVTFGATTPAEMLDLAVRAEASGVFDSVWVGDSVLAKPRLEAITLMTAIAARTSRVKIAPGCLASFPLRHPLLLAYQWASLDLIAEGRTILCVCKGDAAGGGDIVDEWRAMNVPLKSRHARMEESIRIVRKLFCEDNVTFMGEYYEFENVTIAPKPDTPPPIWIAANPHTAGVGPKTVEKVRRRIARLADGWMTTFMSPEMFRDAWASLAATLKEHGRHPETYPRFMYYNVNIGESKAKALAESKKFLDTYYMTDFAEPMLDALWVAAGSVEECADRLRAFVDAGANGITLRLTSWDQDGQFRRLVDEVLPRVFG
jgi:alkanesulfonate monooxygenase SsuD/methylene tetrahydromethanopterin reductase-like flavin-dependent oxidoreductase (luciferase family)